MKSGKAYVDSSTLDEIRKVVAKHHGVVTFVTMAAAEDYRRTQSIREHDSSEAVSA